MIAKEKELGGGAAPAQVVGAEEVKCGSHLK